MSKCTFAISYFFPGAFIVLLAGSFQLPLPAVVHAQSLQEVYWTEQYDNELNRANADGSDAEQVLGRFSAPRDVALDVASNTMYFVDSSDDAVYRANLDGSNPTEIAYVSAPRGIALDAPNNHLYVAADGTDRIVRLGTNGSNIVGLVPTANGATGIALDPINEHVYWTQSGNGGTSAVRRANLDGTGVTTLVLNPADRVGHIELDVENGKMYWTALRISEEPSAIQSANLDGSGVEDLVVSESIGNPNGIALDAANGFVYWNDSAGGPYRAVRRATLAGNGVTELYTDVTSPSGMALDPSNDHLYFTDFAQDNVKRIGTDGSNPSPLIEAALADYARFVVDTKTEFVYLSDWRRGQIVRLSPDESAVETVIEDLNRPSAITIDASNQRLYWREGSSNTDDRIRSATLSGQDATTLFSTENIVSALAFSSTDQKLYWTDLTSGRLRRANPDGSEVETAVASAPDAVALAVDDQNKTVYWSERGNERIRRASLDGSNITDVVTTGAEDVRGLTVDPTSEKLYWADYSGAGVRRSNLDGSSIETIATVNAPAHVAVKTNGPRSVELTSFDVTWHNQKAELSWLTTSETDNSGFYVERATDAMPFSSIGFVQGAGTTNEPQQYQFVDDAVPQTASMARYRLRQVDANDIKTYSSIEMVRILPSMTELRPPAPNPVHTHTTLRYSLPAQRAVRLDVFDVLGRRVTTLVDDTQPSGWHTVTLNTDQLQKLVSGIYFVQLTVDEQSYIQRFAIVR